MAHRFAIISTEKNCLILLTKKKVCFSLMVKYKIEIDCSGTFSSFPQTLSPCHKTVCPYSPGSAGTDSGKSSNDTTQTQTPAPTPTHLNEKPVVKRWRHDKPGNRPFIIIGVCFYAFMY